MVLAYRLPLRVRPLICLLPLSFCPGQMPTQEARCSASGKVSSSQPTSANRVSRTRRLTPVISSNRSSVSWCGASRSSISRSGDQWLVPVFGPSRAVPVRESGDGSSCSLLRQEPGHPVCGEPISAPGLPTSPGSSLHQPAPPGWLAPSCTSDRQKWKRV